jgi:hypothetical protein
VLVNIRQPPFLGRIKQYHKEGRALRTETAINNPNDFGIGKRLTNLSALRQIGFTANRRLLAVQQLSHDPARGAEAFAAVTDPILTAEGTRIPGLRFTDPRDQALLHALLVFKLLPSGFANRDLRVLEVAPIGVVVVPGGRTDTGPGDHGVATLCDHRGDLCLRCHHG